MIDESDYLKKSNTNVSIPKFLKNQIICITYPCKELMILEREVTQR